MGTWHRPAILELSLGLVCWWTSGRGAVLRATWLERGLLDWASDVAAWVCRVYVWRGGDGLLCDHQGLSFLQWRAEWLCFSRGWHCLTKRKVRNNCFLGVVVWQLVQAYGEMKARRNFWRASLNSQLGSEQVWGWSNVRLPFLTAALLPLSKTHGVWGRKSYVIIWGQECLKGDPCFTLRAGLREI